MEEQTATTNEMARSVAEAATGSGEIALNITGVARTAADTGAAAASTNQAADELARMRSRGAPPGRPVPGSRTVHPDTEERRGHVPGIKVLVVDDSVVVRRLVSDALVRRPRLDVVGTAANGQLALAKIPQLTPDLVTLDIEMPEMDGIETLRELRAGAAPAAAGHHVLHADRARRRGDARRARAGASDYVTKPANVGSVTAVDGAGPRPS